jgi:hypothetical protein
MIDYYDHRTYNNGAEQMFKFDTLVSGLIPAVITPTVKVTILSHHVETFPAKTI